MAADTLTYRFTADTSGLKSGLAAVRSQLSGLSAAASGNTAAISSGFEAMRQSLAKVGDSTAKVTLGLSAFAAAASAALLGVGARAAIFGEQIRTAAGAFDQTVTTASEIKAVADRAGSSLETVGKSFVDLQKKARDGDEAVVTALRAVGLSASQVSSLTQRELAIKMADTFSSLRDSSNKTAAAVALFGADVAGKLVPQLNRGTAAIADMMEAAHRSGAVIGPELSGKLAGTAEMFQRLQDKFSEFRMVATGKLLNVFQALKPAIDALAAAFIDIVGNVTRLVQAFFNVGRAGEGSGNQLGIVLRLLKAGAELFAKAMINAIVYVEEFLVKAGAALVEIGERFVALGRVAAAFAQDLRTYVVAAADGLFEAFKQAIGGVIALFNDLAAAGARALSFDFSGVKSSFAQFGQDAAGVSAKIADSFKFGPSATSGVLDEINKEAAARRKARDEMLAGLEEQRKRQLAVLASGGAAAPPTGARIAGDPTVRKAADNAREARTAVERYLDSLNKAAKTAQAEADTWAKSNVERARTVALAQLQAAAEKDGVALTEQQKQKAAQLATQTQMLRDKVEGLKSAAQGLADTFASALDDLIVKGGKFNDVMKQVLQTLASAALKAGLTGDGMFGAFGGGAPGSGGLLGGLFKGLISGFRADGGPVMGGRAYVVGERGPELFRPNGGGAIVPNGGGSATGGGGPMQIVVDVRGATGNSEIHRMVSAGVQAGIGQFSKQVLPGRVNEISLRGV